MTPTVHAHPWYSQAHHTRSGFRNIWETPGEGEPFVKAAFWLLRHGLADRQHQPPEVHPIDPAALHAPPERLRITWLGHAATLIQTPTLTLLTDPMLGDRASPVPFAGPVREVPVPIAIEALPAPDAVLLSHDHYDHLDAGSIRELATQYDPHFFVPLGVAPTVRSFGARHVTEMDWWQVADLDGGRLHCTPAKHFSGRGLLNRNGTLWASWMIETDDPDLRIYFGADSGYAQHFADIRAHLGAPDVALLPIGAYRPRWFMRRVHMNPPEAVQAFQDLGARHFVPIHWGTFDLSEELLHEPPADLRQAAEAAGISEQVHLLEIGEAFDLTAAATRQQAA